MPTLAELRARAKNTQQNLPTRSLEVCTDQSAMARIWQLSNEKSDLLAQSQRTDENGEQIKPPKRAGQKDKPGRIDAIDTELETLWDQMRESQGTLLLRATDGGEWQRWKDEHPPVAVDHAETVRANGDKMRGEPVYAREDFVLAANGQPLGYFNLSAVRNDLGRWVKGWNDEALDDGEWDAWLSKSIAPGDLKEAAILVVQMHEERLLVLPKSSSGLSATGSDETA